jgi:choline-glycine betaine transporter
MVVMVVMIMVVLVMTSELGAICIGNTRNTPHIRSYTGAD